MLAVNRIRAQRDDPAILLEQVGALIDALAGQPGFVRAQVGRNLDEPDLWVLITEWDSVGTYRRGLSSHVVKASGYPIFLQMQDEPGAYEQLLGSG